MTTATPSSAPAVLRWIDRRLDDAALGFFALVSLFLLLMPVAFALSPGGNRIVQRIELGIIGLFFIEYLTALVLAPDKRAFLLNRWRILDALIILAAGFALFPAGPEMLRNSPALRLLRLGRLALLGTRSGLAITVSGQNAEARYSGEQKELEVSALDPSGSHFDALPWDEALQRIRSAEPDWLFIRGVQEGGLAPIAEALQIPEEAIAGLFRSSVPRFDRLERFSVLFVRYPRPLQEGERMRRTPVLLVGTGENVVVLSRDHTDLEVQVGKRLASLDPALPRMIRATLALVGEIIRAYTQVMERLEKNLLDIEAVHTTLKDPQFLSRTFELRADILRVRSSLKHLKTVVRDLSHGQVTIAGAQTNDAEIFRFLADDCGDLYEGIEDLRESLQALVDLRLNVSSFQMNRVMRLLALLTALALIPATAGGLLGMNLADTPWPPTLAQVAFGVAAGMAFSMYVFAIKGWLR